MSKPRPVVPGTSYMITRRCTQRQFWIRPSPIVNQIFVYCLAVAADKYGILIHALCVLSNHYHLELTDPHGQLPKFTAWLNEFVAKCVNAHHGRWENMWTSSEQTSHVILSDDASFVREVAYTLANPVEAALVERGSLWPGVRMCFSAEAARDVRIVRIVLRPELVFRDKESGGEMPPLATLHLSRPPGFLAKTDVQVAQLLRDAAIEREKKLREKIFKGGGSFLGVRKILAQNPWDSPSTREPRRNMSPRVAGDTGARVEALQWLKWFEAEYRDCWDRWQAGERRMTWPIGTYKMIAIHGENIAQAPP